MGSGVGGLSDSIHRAELSATGTANALILVNGVSHQMLADLCGAGLVLDVCQVLMAEVGQGRNNGVGSGLTQSTQGVGLTV